MVKTLLQLPYSSLAARPLSQIKNLTRGKQGLEARLAIQLTAIMEEHFFGGEILFLWMYSFVKHGGKLS